MTVLLGLSLFLWGLGYLLTTRAMSNAGLSSDEIEKIIQPPIWLFILCGAPVSKDYKKGTMRVGAFRSQMSGLILGIYTIMVYFLAPSRPIVLSGFLLSALLPILISHLVAKNYTVRERFAKRKENLS